MMRWKSHAIGAIAALSVSTAATAQVDISNVARTDVVLDWNAITMRAVGAQNGVEQVRLAAIAHLAMFEAVNAIEGHFAPYLGTVVAPADASPEAAAVAAAHAVLSYYVPDQATDLDAERVRSLAGIPDGRRKKRGIAVGEAAANALILHRINDGSGPAEFYQPQSGDPGQWQLTPGCPPQGGLFLHWRQLSPFGIERADQFQADPPPPLTGKRFSRDFNEVKALGAVDSLERPPDRSDVARFFAAVPSQAAWNPIARQIAARSRRALSDDARLFALLNMAMNDALIAVIESKYRYPWWRPETAIRAGDTDGNPATEPDPGFQPFIPTPCHPSYPSAHASASRAAREVLEHLFGDKRHSVVLSTAALPTVELRYTRLRQVTRDIDDARIYGGVHFRFDQQTGSRQGQRVGAYIVAHKLRRAKARHHTVR